MTRNSPSPDQPEVFLHSLPLEQRHAVLKMLNATSQQDSTLSRALITAMAQSMLLGSLNKAEAILNNVQSEIERNQPRVSQEMEDLPKQINFLERNYASMAVNRSLHPVPPAKIVSGKLMQALGMIGFAITLSLCGVIYNRVRLSHDSTQECARARSYGDELQAWARHIGLVKTTLLLRHPPNPNGCPPL